MADCDCGGITPVHLRTKSAIAKKFGVRRETVATWLERGAPIAMVGKTYMAEYNVLMAWLVNERKG